MVITSQKRVLFKHTLYAISKGVFVVVAMIVFVSSVFTLLAVTRAPQARVQAASAKTLNFQARLLGSAGYIVPDGYYNIEFKLYNASTGGSALWTETRYDSNGATAGNDNRVQVKAGYVSVYLGDITDLPSNIWTQQLWLTMNIGGTTQTATPTWDGEMTPRLRLTAVPVAYSLTNYNSVTGYSSSLSLSGATGGDQSFTVPDQGAAGSYTLLTTQAANGAYIQNQSATDQTADFRISGTGRANTALQAPLFDTATAAALAIGTTNATAINLNQNTTVATGKNLTVTAGATILTGAVAGSSTGVTINAGHASNVGLVVKGAASQTADLLEVQDSTGAVLVKVNNGGSVIIPSSALVIGAASGLGGGLNVQTASAGSVGQVIRASAAQTAELLQVQDSAGNVNASFDAAGNQLTLGRIASSGTVTQGTLVVSDGTTSGFGVTLQSSTLTADRKFLFPDTVLATTASPGTICVYNGSSSNCPAATGSSFYLWNSTTVQPSSNFYLRSAATGSVVGVLEGANGQTADLLDLNTYNGTTSTTVAKFTAAGNLQVASSVDVNTATTLTLGGTNATAITVGNAGASTVVRLKGGATTGAVVVGTGTSDNFTIDAAGRATFQATSADTSNFKVLSHDGAVNYINVSETDGQTRFNGTVCVISGGACTQGSNSLLTVQGGTFIGSSGSYATLLTPVTSFSQDARLVVDNYTYTAYKAGIAVSMNAASDAASRGIVVYDARNSGDHQPSISVLSPDEGSLGGLSWDGSTTTFKVETSPLAGSTSAISLQSGNSSGNSSTTGNVYVQSGSNTGTNSNSGSVYIDAGTKTGTGTAGSVSVGATNASAVSLGHSGITTTNAGALTVSQLLTGQLGTTISGATINLNASSNNATNINTGTSTGAVTIGNGTSTAGTITLQGSASSVFTATNATGTTKLAFAAPSTAGTVTFNLPAGGTGGNTYGICTTLTVCTGYIGSSLQDNVTDALDIQEGTNNYINVNTTNGSENISLGNATTNPSVSFLGTGTATFNGSVVVAASQSLRLIGGNTASRPASPTEGMVYYDTTTHQLLTYNNSKWVSDRTDAIIVAASNSSQTDKDAADYVADGNTGAANDGDQVQINAALTAAAGKKVVLLAGTYTADATILIPNNTTLTGVGKSTLIQLADIDATDNLIENSDTATGTGVVIRDMQLDGQQSLQTGSITQNGIALNHMGSQAAGRFGARLENLYIKDFHDAGMFLDTSENNTITNTTFYSMDTGGSAPAGVYSDSSSNNSYVGNTFLSNYWGLRLDGSGNHGTTITGNVFRGNSQAAVFNFGAVGTTITSNTFDANVNGVNMYTGGSATVSGNTFYANTGYSVFVDDSSSNTITGNRIQNSGNTTDNNAIYIQNNSDSNTITSNTITDSSATTTNYAIRIASAGSDTNYLSDNSLGGGTINDSGTGTVYGGQTLASAGDFLFRGANSATAFRIQNAAGTSTYFNVDSSTNAVTVANATINLNASSNFATNINTGTSTGTTTIGNSSNTNNTVTIDAGNTGGIAIGNSASAHTINIAAGGGANNQTINIGTGVTGGSNTSTITVGSANAAASTTTLQGGNGAGAISLQAATSGTITIGTTNGNAITLGTSSSATTNAGTFNVGASAGTGAFVNNGTTLNTTTTQSTGSNTSISNVNAYTSFVLTATTTGISYTLPDPSPTTAGKIVYIINASSGSNTFTLAPTNGPSVVLNTGAAATLVWNGSAWTYAGTDTSNLQNAYNNSTGSTTPEMLLDSTRTGVDIQDANTTLGSSTPLFAVRGSATASTLGSALFTVTNNANAPLVGIGTNVATRALDVSVSNSTTNALPLLVRQASTGDAGLELRTTTASWYVGADNSDSSAFKISSSVASGNTSVLGNSSIGSTDDTSDNNIVNAGKYVASASGSVTSLSVYIACTISGSPNNQFRMGLYTNSAGTPGTLLVGSSAQTLATGWNTVIVSPTAVTSGTTYWIGYNTNGTLSTNNCFRKSTSGGELFWSTSYSFAAMPGTWPGTAGNDTSNASFYATVENTTANDSFAVQLFNMSTTGAATFQNSTNSTTAFQIQNAAGTSMLTADTTNTNLTLTSTSTASTLLNVTNNSATTNTVSAITTNALTTGKALSISSTGTGTTSGSLLYVSTATTGAVATNGIVSLNATGNYTSTSNAGLLNIAANTTQAGTITNVSGNALTTGVGINVGSTGTGLTTGSLLKISSATTGAVATNGIVAIQATGNYTSTSNIGALTVQANSTAAGTIQRIEGNALTTGVGLSIASTGTGLTTGSLLAVSSATTGAVATNGIVNFTASGNYTSTSNYGLLNAIANSTAAGTVVNIQGNALTTGVGVNIAGTGTGLTTGSLLNVTSATTGAVATNGVVSLNATGNYTSTSNVGLLNAVANATTAGTVANISGNALTTGVGLNVASTGTGLTTGSLLKISSATTGAVATSGIVSIQATGNYTSTSNIGALTVQANSTTAGTIERIEGNALTTGVGLSIASTGTGLTTGSLLNVTSATTGAVATNGIVSFQATGNYTSTSNVGLLNAVANATTAGTIVNISGTALTTGVALNINANNGTAIKTAGNYQFASGANRTMSVETNTANAAGYNLTISAGAAGSGAAAFTGGTLTLQGGAAGGTGNANGGGISISGGTGTGTGVKGLVVIDTPTFSTASSQNCAGADCTITQANIDSYGAVLVSFTSTGFEAAMPDPNQTTAGRIVYVTAAVGSSDFTLCLNDVAANGTYDGTCNTTAGNSIAMRANTTATLVWNGTDWTAAGASSSTDLQAAYNNTLTSAGGAELVLNAAGGAADGLTVRNNGTTPISGGLLEVQTSIGTNLFSVNNYGTELASNGGAETAGGSSTTFPASTWSAQSTATVSRTITSGEYQTGQAGVKVVTTGTSQGVKNQLSGNPVTGGVTYTVSFTAASSTAGSGTTPIEVIYSPDNGTTMTNVCSGFGDSFTTSRTISNYTNYNWTKVTCTVTTTATAVTTPLLIIRQTDATSRTIYVDNLSFIRNDSTTRPSNVQVGGGNTGGQVTLFTFDRSSTAPLVSGADDRYLGSMYYDTTLGSLQCYEADGWGACGSAPDNIVSFTPEYTGAVLNGTGVGTMTADFCGNGGGLSVNTTFCASGEARNYYKWTSPQATSQSYSIYVTYRLPSTFKSFVSGTTSLTGLTDDTGNAGMSYGIYRKASGGGLTNCSADTTVVGWNGSSGVGSNNTWTTGTAGTLGGTTDPSTCTSFVAGDSVIFKITLNARSNKSAYAENLTFRYSNK